MSSTTTGTTTSSSEEEDPSKPKLVNTAAKQWWENNFGEEEKVSNKEFQAKICEKLEEQKSQEGEAMGYNADASSQRLFAKLMVERIFWPADNLDSNQNPNYVDQSCVQFAINTFGPWSKIFQTIHQNLEDVKQPHKPLQYFHGRTTKQSLDDKLVEPGEFALRYAEGDKGLILSWAKPSKDNNSGITVKDEKVRRLKVKKTTKKKKGKKGKKSKKKDDEPEPESTSHIYWRYEEKVAEIGRMRKDKHDFDSLGEFLNYKKGSGNTGTVSKKKKKTGINNIENPVMFGSAYQTFGALDNKLSESEQKIAEGIRGEVDKVDLSSFN